MTRALTRYIFILVFIQSFEMRPSKNTKYDGSQYRQSEEHTSAYPEKCIVNLTATVKAGHLQDDLFLHVQWSVKKKGSSNSDLSGFVLSYVSESGRSGYFEISKSETSYNIPISFASVSLEQINIVIECMGTKQHNPAQIIVKSSELCEAMIESGIPTTYKCLSQLKNLKVKKCHGKKISVSWSTPNVTGYKSYLVRHSAVHCKGKKDFCCHLSYKNSFTINQEYNSFTIPDITSNSEHCMEILMCPDNGADKLNCEVKYPSFLVSCRKDAQSLYQIIFGVTIPVIVVCGIIFFCCWRHWSKKPKMDQLNTDSLLELQTQSQTYTNKNEKSNNAKTKEPLLMIVFCSGCIAVEEFVVNLVHILRINGVNAVSELTEENQVHKYGLGVYVSSRLEEADFILMLCTEELIDEGRLQSHIPYHQALNMIQNQVYKQEPDLTRYLPVHFNQQEKIPGIFRSSGINFGDPLHEGLEYLLRRVFEVRSYQIGEDAACRNRLEFSRITSEKIQMLMKCRKRIEELEHVRCSRATCRRGMRISP